MDRSRGYCFTLNNWTKQEKDNIFENKKDVKYVVVGEEVGESGTPHLQGFIYFTNKKSFKQVKEHLGVRAHVERQKGSARQAIDYCKKDGVTTEWGIEPAKPGGDSMKERAKRNKRLLEDDMHDLVAEGVLAPNQIPVIKKARLILANEKPSYTSETVRGIWFYGPPGTGKTHAARHEYGSVFYIKPQNKWFDGYQGEKVIVLDDLDKQGACLGHYLKIWADKWACTGEVKGGTVPLQHDKFIVTSNYSIDELFGEDLNMRDAISRRFEERHFLIKYQ